MHEIFDGPLKRTLERHLTGVTGTLVNVSGIIFPPEIISELQLGNLQEDFWVTGLRGEEFELRKKMLGIVDKLYECIGLKCHKQDAENGVCLYTPSGNASGVGVIFTFTFDLRVSRLLATCVNFGF